MRINLNIILPSALSLLLGFACLASAQETVNVDSLSGTVTCANGTVITISPQDPATASTNGDNVDTQSNDTVRANCPGLLSGPLLIATIGQASDEAIAIDNASQNSGEGKQTIQTVSILGGLFKFDKNVTDVIGTFTPPSHPTSGTISGTTTITNAVLNGTRLTFTTTTPISFRIDHVRLLTQPGCLLGSAEYDGSLTANLVTTTTSGPTTTTEFDAVKMDVTIECLLDTRQPRAHVVLTDELFQVYPCCPQVAGGSSSSWQ